MAITGRAFSGTPADAALFQPYVAPSHLCRYGTPIGIDRRTGAVVYFDPWQMKKLELIVSTIFLITGMKNAGKSTLVKMLIMRLMTRQAGLDANGYPVEMRARITSRKPENERDKEDASDEYDALMKELVSDDTLDINQPGLFNIFGSSFCRTEADMLEVAFNTALMANDDQPLTGHMAFAIQLGVSMMLRHFGDAAILEVLEAAIRHSNMGDVNGYYRNSNAELLRSLETFRTENPHMYHMLKVLTDRPIGMSEAAYLDDAAKSANLFGRVLRGDFGRIFSGSKNPRDILTAPVGLINLTGVTAKPRMLLETMLWRSQTTGLLYNDQALNPHINAGDELGEGMNSLTYARSLDYFVSKARALPTFELDSTQYTRQISEAGSADSEIRTHGKNIMLGIGGHFLLRQPDDDDVLEGVSRLGISDQDVFYTTQMPTGCVGIKVPNQPLILAQVVLTPTEFRIAQTNAANDEMTQFAAVMSFPEIEARARAAGILQVGTGQVITPEEIARESLEV